MAMIKCPYCGQEISDKATKCVHCGQELVEVARSKKICSECGKEVDPSAKFCPYCGYPFQDVKEEPNIQKVEVSKISIEKSSIKKVLFGVMGVVIVVMIIIGGMNINKKQEAEIAAEKYQDTLNNAAATMLIGGLSAEHSASLIHDVWYNTIYEEDSSETDAYTKNYGSFNDDFNTSLQTLFSDESFQGSISALESTRDKVQDYMKALQTPPEGYEDAYNAVKDLYDAFLDITECAINPTGNLTTYTESFNKADSDFSKKYKAMDMYTTELKKTTEADK